MNKQEKVTFVKELADAILLGIINKINLDKIPERWEGKELRAYFCDKASEAYDRFPLRGKEAGAYENDKLVKNL
jgi:hypothetical protein